jgi:hypothetical protein
VARTTRLAGLATGLGMLMAIAAVTTGPASASSRQYCPPTPRTAAAGQVPVWVLLEVRTKTGVLVKDVAFAVRRYRNNGTYVVPGWAYSSCWSVLLYKNSNLPARLCITVRLPYTAPDGACQAVRSGPTGQKEVRFRLVSA